MPTLKLIKIPNLNLPVISLKILSEDCFFIVDTGAEVSILSISLIPILNRRQELLTRVSFGIGIGDGLNEMKDIPIVFTLIGVSLKMVTFGEDIISKLQAAYKESRLKGILGNDLMRCFSNVSFDFKNEVIRFTS